jgi:hypothetical protein
MAVAARLARTVQQRGAPHATGARLRDPASEPARQHRPPGLRAARRRGFGREPRGFTTSWLITHDRHFAAIALADRYTNAEGRYFTRSAVMYAHKVKTPTLSLCGALDRCTPPSEAMQFHAALLEAGVKSVLVTYPEEATASANSLRASTTPPASSPGSPSACLHSARRVSPCWASTPARQYSRPAARPPSRRIAASRACAASARAHPCQLHPPPARAPRRSWVGGRLASSKVSGLVTTQRNARSPGQEFPSQREVMHAGRGATRSH